MTQKGMRLQSVSYDRHHLRVLTGIDLKIKPGEMVALIGPNGAGKSTLLKLMMKLLKPDEGEIYFEGRHLSDWRQDDLAQSVAYLPQNPKAESPFTCQEVVLMGRYARLSRFAALSKNDEDVAKSAMQETGTTSFSGRLFNALSGGEQQRVLLARAVAQQADLLLLDEPTASLDLRYQLLLFELIQTLAKKGCAVFIALHDLNLAARYCSRLILLHEGRIVADGSPQAVLTPEHLEAVYGVHTVVSAHTASNALSVIPISVSERGQVIA